MIYKAISLVNNIFLVEILFRSAKENLSLKISQAEGKVGEKVVDKVEKIIHVKEKLKY